MGDKLGMIGSDSKLGSITHWRLEKFDGEYEEGKIPVEVIEGGDGIPTVRKDAAGNVLEVLSEPTDPRRMK